jgi:hypothetical protein
MGHDMIPDMIFLNLKLTHDEIRHIMQKITDMTEIESGPCLLVLSRALIAHHFVLGRILFSQTKTHCHKVSISISMGC